ncbi:MAG: hypothetical protein WAQ29_04365 [Nitrososphaeraceae archaeon]
MSSPCYVISFSIVGQSSSELIESAWAQTTMGNGMDANTTGSGEYDRRCCKYNGFKRYRERQNIRLSGIGRVFMKVECHAMII